MKRIVFIYGIIIGTVLCINMVVMMNLMYTNPDFKSNDILGYAAMVLLFSLIFFGARNYRNKYQNGLITFGKAFKVGALIALISATMYVVVWLFYYYLFVPDFIDVYTTYVLNETSAAELPAKAEEMEQFKEMYKNPLFVVLITYFEVLPIGLLIALISAWVLKKTAKNE